MSRLRSSAILLLVFCVVAGITAGGSLHQPAPARADIGPVPLPGIPNPCDWLPDGAAQTICKATTNPVGTAVGAIPGVPDPLKKFLSNPAGSIAQVTFNAAFDFGMRKFAAVEADSFNWVITEEFKLVDDATIPNLTDEVFTAPFALVFGLSLLIALGLTAFSLGKAAYKNDPSIISDSVVALIVFFLAVPLLVSATAAAVKVSDGTIAPGIVNSSSTNIKQAINNINANAAGHINLLVGLGEILFFIILLIVALLSGLLFFILFVLRVFGLPLVLVGLIFSLGLRPGGEEVEGGRTRQLGWALFGLVVYKVAVAFIMLFGALVLVKGVSTFDIWPVLFAIGMQLSMPFFCIWAWRWLTTHNFQPSDVHRRARGALMFAYARFANQAAGTA